MTTENLAMMHVPTWRDHFRRITGYGWRDFPDVDADPRAAKMPGWFLTEVAVNLSFADRLRLLVSGRLRLRIENRASAPVEEVITSSGVCIVSPFDSPTP